MPRAFLVKKPSVSPGKRSWSDLPDHERGDIYIPGEGHTLIYIPFNLNLKKHRPNNGKRELYNIMFNPLAMTTKL